MELFGSIFNSLITWVNDMLTSFLTIVFSILPTSPFSSAIDAIGNIPFLETLNWFIPIGTFIAIGEGWLLAIATFYIYSAILRWIKAIE